MDGRYVFVNVCMRALLNRKFRTLYFPDPCEELVPIGHIWQTYCFIWSKPIILEGLNVSSFLHFYKFDM